MKNILKLIKIFQNEQGTLLNKVEQLITASPTLTYYLPTLISAPFNLSPQQSPLLTMFTSATGSTRSRSTRHQGSLSSVVCVHLFMAVALFPFTALLARNWG